MISPLYRQILLMSLLHDVQRFFSKNRCPLCLVCNNVINKSELTQVIVNVRIQKTY